MRVKGGAASTQQLTWRVSRCAWVFKSPGKGCRLPLPNSHGSPCTHAHTIHCAHQPCTYTRNACIVHTEFLLQCALMCGMCPTHPLVR